MKILHLVGGEINGGAARGAYWLHKGLLAQGLESTILTDSQSTLNDSTVISISNGKKGKIALAVRRAVDLAPTLFYPQRRPVIFSSGIAGYDFLSHPAYGEADIVHLHWVNGGFVRLKDIERIDKPVVWTLRDMWPMTGGCHYALECKNYKTGCGRCPQLESALRIDISKWLSASKERHIPKKTKIVGISHWISNEARSSRILGSHDVRTIFNNIDTQEFFPLDKEAAKAILDIHTDKRIILVGAQSLADFYKGFDKLIEAIQALDRSKYHLCLFGNVDRQMIAATGFDVTMLGFLHDSISLRVAYSAADVFVAPSMMDAFGKTLAEALACGTPVVCFDATGPQDVVDHMQNGYRARPFVASDLAAGIEWVCVHHEPQVLREAARAKAVASFDSRLIASQYVELYKEMLSKKCYE